MVRSYLKSALRSLLKDKKSSFISISGLAVGMACCMLILIHIKDELSFNKFNSNLDNIYRINWISRDKSGVNVYSSTPVPFSKSLTSKIPGIEKLSKLFQRSGEMESGRNDKSEGKRFQEQNVYFSDPGLFGIFSIVFIEGDIGNLVTKLSAASMERAVA